MSQLRRRTGNRSTGGTRGFYFYQTVNAFLQKTPPKHIRACLFAASNIILLSATDFCLAFESAFLVEITGDWAPKVFTRRVRGGSWLEGTNWPDETWLEPVEPLSRILVDA